MNLSMNEATYLGLCRFHGEQPVYAVNPETGERYLDHNGAHAEHLFWLCYYPLDVLQEEAETRELRHKEAWNRIVEKHLGWQVIEGFSTWSKRTSSDGVTLFKRNKD